MWKFEMEAINGIQRLDNCILWCLVFYNNFIEGIEGQKFIVKCGPTMMLYVGSGLFFI